jgi:O-antigen/teichoic acid export membrane protein
LPKTFQRQSGSVDVAVFGSSIGLIAGRVASMGLGFLAWLVAARLFVPEEVGLASGAVAAMMLCVQLALFGIGSAVIKLYPGERHAPSDLLNSSLSSVLISAFIMGLAFLVLARGLFSELNAIAAAPALAAIFVAMTVFGTVNVFMDYLSVAQRRGAQVLVRNVSFGLVTIAMPLVLFGMFPGAGTTLILSAWAAAGLVACTIGTWQLLRAMPEYRWRLQLNVRRVRGLVAVGLPNWALTMTERGPALLLPVLVTEMISPATNAFWYAAWMMAWVVMIIPISVGQTLFAEASREPERTAAATRHGLATSMALGSAAALGMMLLARVALGLLGSAYADAGEWALRVLVVSVIPFSLTQAYYALCRARGMLGEAIAAGGVFGLGAVVASIAAGVAGGLTLMAVGWLAVQGIAGLWALLRLRSLVGGGSSS